MLPENCFLFSSEDLAQNPRSQLRGYATCDGAIVFGTSGLDAFVASGGAPNDLRCGRFSATVVESDSIVFRTDLTGQEIHYLFREGDTWAVSNSFLLLATWAAQRATLTMHAPAISGFFLKGGTHIGEQLLSHHTLISSIKIVPAATEIVVDRKSGQVGLRRAASLKEDISDYASALLDFLERGAGLLGALAEAGADLRINLSGGYDSRLVLAMALAGGAQEAIHLTSDPGRQNDFRSASGLAERLDLPLNEASPGVPSVLSDGEAYRIWALSCVGTYLPIYPVSHMRLHHPTALRLTGDQPTGWDHFSGTGRFKGTPSRIADHVRSDLKGRAHADAVARDFLSVFQEIDFDPEHPRAMMAHYSAVRARHHCGRQWYRSLGSERLVTALMDPAMLALDLFAGEQDWPVTQLLADALSAFGGWAIEHPFETPDRTFSPEMLARSPFGSGADIRPRETKVFGLVEHSAPASHLGLLDLPVHLRSRPEAFRDHLVHSFWTAERARACGLFEERDLVAAKAEINAAGSLSHGFRRTAHVVMTDMVLDVVSGSRTAP